MHLVMRLKFITQFSFWKCKKVPVVQSKSLLLKESFNFLFFFTASLALGVVAAYPRKKAGPQPDLATVLVTASYTVYHNSHSHL